MWRFPIEDLAALQRPRKTLLFGRSVMEPQPNRIALVDRLLEAGRLQVSAVFERKESWHFEIASREQLAVVLSQDGHGDYRFSSDCYVEVNGGAVVGYSSLRDSFGIWAVDSSLLRPGEIDRWDRSFVFLQSRMGVGFGEEGRAYLRKLLSGWDSARGAILMATIGLT